MGAAGDARLVGGGYVIYNRRITRADWRGWSTYTGSNPHTSHVHVSFSRNRSGFDDSRGWGFGTSSDVPAPPSSGRPTLQVGSRGEAVKSLQRTLNRWYPGMTPLVVDGDFGPATKGRVVYFQQRAGLTTGGIVGPRTWAALGYR
ncbi:peptidoglycan-binding domain-containing protein [Kibdelosporangium persicum]|uniref:peptidoglycan-binding domain-containing protein n=1 Tax=Kibdelosporangium persicum TaxID=2698649 RepID=UPI0035E440F3